MTGFDDRRRLAVRVLIAMDGMAAAAVEAIGRAFMLAGADGPLWFLGQSFSYAADGIVMYGKASESQLATIAMAYALDRVARSEACLELLGRLEGVEEQPWAALHDALGRLHSCERPAAVRCPAPAAANSSEVNHGR
jgi:hypothetical protein